MCPDLTPQAAPDAFPGFAALDAYRRAFRDPAARHALCEDYRAAAAQDHEHQEHHARERAAGAGWPARRSCCGARPGKGRPGPRRSRSGRDGRPA
ncbi:hypothetical protein [Burkholderia glumae]|uniref:hypothetical protein n=1 Tax=Burkholderia glumae TaxID=337 RepID=UPI000F5EEE36|nr:hypothetical protein [Burkholderia glumae]MCQ0029911.1 hypothetical protein [Burkholderia glumae]MCQ0039713.1 hypothetical protein [Burkholderia glumae]QJW81941.1 hypothetical protein GAS18_25530 [Burkholderia glumae]